MQMEEADGDDIRRGAHINRSDVAQGLLRITGTDLVDDKDTMAPLFAYACHMQDKTSLRQQAQSCLWVLHTTACMLQTGHLNAAYMNAQGRLKCIPPSSKGAKTIVVPCDAFGEDILEIKPQLRVIRAT